MVSSTTDPPPPQLPARQAEYLLLGAESRSIEFKQSISWQDPNQRMMLIRTFMAMANNRDGGAVVVGVDENGDGTYSPTGMSQGDFDSFDPDSVAEQTRKYAEPPVRLTTVKGSRDGALYTVVEVRPFDRVPIVCRTADGGTGVLREAAVYIRTDKPETKAISTYAEMREILDLAVEREIMRLRELGLVGQAESVTESSSGIDELNAELKEFA